MNPGLERICGDIATAWLNSAYQGLVLGFLVMGYLHWNRRNNASTRHAVLLATLVVIAVLPAGHLAAAWWPSHQRQSSTTSLTQLDEQRVAAPRIQTQAVSSATTEVRTHNLPLPAGPRSRAGATKTTLETGSRLQNPSETKGSTHNRRTEPIRVQNTVAGAPTQERGDEAARTDSPAKAQEPRVHSGAWAWASKVRPTTLLWPSGFNHPAIAPAIVALWLTVACLLLIRLARQYFLLCRLKQESLPPASSLQFVFEPLARELAGARQPRLRVSHPISVPLATGFSHPAVLLPHDLAHSGSPDGLRPVLRHALAHLARRDDWANLVQLTVQAICFFQPAVWWISRRMTIEREIACDDRVLESEASPRSYALLLTEFVSRRPGTPWVTASAAWTNKSQLQERIDMILNTKRSVSPRLAPLRAGILTSCAVLLALVGLRIAPRVALGDTAPPSAATPAPGGLPSPLSAPNPSGTGVESPAPIAEVESGPRAKSAAPVPGFGTGLQQLPAVADPATPMPPPPIPQAFSVAAAEPLSGNPPPRLDVPSASNPFGTQPHLEDRLQRLEKMVQELLSRQSNHPSLIIEGPASMLGARQVEIEAQKAEIEARQQALEAEKEAAEAAKEAIREAKEAEAEARRDAEEARREAAEAAKEAQMEAKQAQEEARREAEEARREAADAKREAEANERQSQSVTRSADSASGSKPQANQNLQSNADLLRTRSDLDQARRDLIRRRAELQHQLVDIEKELNHLKLAQEKQALSSADRK